MNDIQWTKISHDINGNPRYVCSFLSLLSSEESMRNIYDYQSRLIHPTKYEIAVKRANKIGGRKYHTKSYGGGIVFQSYSLKDTEQAIKAIIEKETKGA